MGAGSKVYKLKDYKVLDYFVTHVDLEIDLSKQPIRSKAVLKISPNEHVNSKERSRDLMLHGENMKLITLFINDIPLLPDEYELTETSLTIKNVPQDKMFVLESTTELGENKDLFGLYETEGTVLVKAETEGLRRVFFCNDRPDNLATYRTTIIADKEKYPVLLSNGSLVGKSTLPGGLHSAVWEDKTPKPSYLFALVAGKLILLEDDFTTRAGRKIPIEFYVPEHARDQCDFAMKVLIKAMAWDEDTYDLECGLPQHMVAGVDKYASGASEPTGLNLFNTANLFALPESKTDMGFLRVLEVIAHEFFHYWSGDRVTIRDWFNLPLKEGLTTFRTAMFREELFGTDLVRLMDGKNLTDSAPRQSEYTAVRSLYTAAAYEKSADIFRMLMMVVGKDIFNKALNHFFTQYDGRAVNLEDILDSLSSTTGKDLHSFLPWFTEPGIPEVTVTTDYDEMNKRYTLKVKTTNGNSRPIPCVIGLLDQTGKEILGDTLLLLDKPEMTFEFNDIQSCPVPSLLRSFSAPVNLRASYSENELLLLIKSDPNIYNRCEAARELITRLVTAHCKGKTVVLSETFFQTYKALLADNTLDEWLLAELLTLPSVEELIADQNKPDFKKIFEAREMIETAMAVHLEEDLFKRYNKAQIETPAEKSQFPNFDIKNAGIRRLKAACNNYFKITQYKNTMQYLMLQFADSLTKNMTETLSALTTLCEMKCPQSEDLLTQFYTQWKNDPGALNYWFALIASTHDASVIERVEKLLAHPEFDLSNPNKVYALLGSFMNNAYGFHDDTGKGYTLIVGQILALDKINPTLAANLTLKFGNREHYDDNRQTMMLDAITNICKHAKSLEVVNTAKKLLAEVRLRERGLTFSPKLAAGDGALGFWGRSAVYIERAVINGDQFTRQPTN